MEVYFQFEQVINMSISKALENIAKQKCINILKLLLRIAPTNTEMSALETGMFFQLITGGVVYKC
ncbi:hypothetical protein ES703_11344 [subsurface metagenome]